MRFRDGTARLAIVHDVWYYMRLRKAYWMGSIILVFIVLGIFIVMVEGSAIAPFIYTLF